MAHSGHSGSLTRTYGAKMKKITVELPKSAWRSIWVRFGVIMAGSTVVSLLLTEIILAAMSAQLSFAGAACALVMPLLLGGPILSVLLIRQAQLVVLNDRLRVLASTDSLTDCLNRRAFTADVATRIAGDGESPAGALLVIDADNFKSVNDRFGHDIGDEALTMIARALKSCLRGDDLLGRLGGEEFGVFLVGASQDDAEFVAHRMLAAIRDIDFAAADGRHCRLSVSIGGAAVKAPTSFAELYRLADRRLYDAKQSGRDRVEFLGRAA